jgi:tetratricopeptide (TPR) repeat protein
LANELAYWCRSRRKSVFANPTGSQLIKRIVSVLSVACLAYGGGLSAKAKQRPVQADEGSVAIGGNVSGSTITIGIPPEQLEALIRDRTNLLEKYSASLTRELDLNQRQVRAALDILGQTNVQPEQLAAKLVEIAQRFKSLQVALTASAGEDRKVVNLKAEAQVAIEAGDLATADHRLSMVEALQASSLYLQSLSAAEVSERRGKVAMTRLKYMDAAQHFGRAASFVQGHDKRIDYMEQEARALYEQGFEYGDNAALRTAIERHREILKLRPTQYPRRWAVHHNRLGLALALLGQREGSPERLYEAISAFQSATVVWSKQVVPLGWATVQNNIGIVLLQLARWEHRTERFEQSIVAFQQALLEQSQERAPLDRARTLNNLGNALRDLGARESGTARLEQAVEVYQQALMVRTRSRVPVEWARTQDNLGSALSTLGERETGTARLEQAIEAFQYALLERTRERLPIAWAETQNNLGLTLLRLGKREGKTTRLKEAVEAFQLSLLERTRSRVPFEWAETQSNLGTTLEALGLAQNDLRQLKASLAAYQEATLEWSRDRAPQRWAEMQNKIDAVLGRLKDRESELAVAPK